MQLCSEFNEQLYLQWVISSSHSVTKKSHDWTDLELVDFFSDTGGPVNLVMDRPPYSVRKSGINPHCDDSKITWCPCWKKYDNTVQIIINVPVILFLLWLLLIPPPVVFTVIVLSFYFCRIIGFRSLPYTTQPGPVPFLPLWFLLPEFKSKFGNILGHRPMYQPVLLLLHHTSPPLTHPQQTSEIGVYIRHKKRRAEGITKKQTLCDLWSTSIFFKNWIGVFW